MRPRLAAAIGAVAAAAILAGPAGAATPAEKRYVALLRDTYVPVVAAWHRSEVPCLRESWSVCAERTRALDRAAWRLAGALVRSRPPRRVAVADRLLERGVRDFRWWIRRYLAAVEGGDEKLIAAAGCRCTVGIDLTNAIGMINGLVRGARLPYL